MWPFTKRPIRHGGGCLGVTGRLCAPPWPISAPADWVAPPYIDNKPYCLEADDQGNESDCVGRAFAGVLETRAWKKSHKPVQFPAHEIYKQAKTIDGEPNAAGTTLMAGFRACVALGLIADGVLPVHVRTQDEVKFALHEYDRFVGAFSITEGWSKVNVKTGRIDEFPGPELGGHAVYLVWFDWDGPGWQNSWGKWGCKGFGRCTWAYFNRHFAGGIAWKDV